MAKKTLTKGRNRAVIKPNSVLIVKPHNVEYKTDERVNQFIMKAFQRGIAEYISVPSKIPELGRNWAIEQFLTNPEFKDKTHIFFLDADTQPVNDMAIEVLMSHNKPVIAGITPIMRRKGDELLCMWSSVTGDFNDDHDFQTMAIEDLPKKVFRAKRVGGTTILIKREVLKKLTKPYQTTYWNEDMTNQVQSEDYYFCDKIREAGFNIYVDPNVKCHHYHNVDLLDVFSVWDASVKAGRMPVDDE